VNRGRVIGEVWGARRAAGLEHQRLVVVALAGEARAIVASDTLGARAGQEVLVALGSGARNVLKAGPDNRDVLTDAAVALLIDGGTEGEP
jgi:microcompartment protein CcmK/EutM